MSTTHPIAHPWLRWWLGLAGWTLLVLIFATQFYLSTLYTEGALTWGEAFLVAGGEWYGWSLLSVPLYMLVKRFPVTRERWGWRSLAYIVIGFVVALVKGALDVALMESLVQAGWIPVLPARFQASHVVYFNVLIYGAVLASGLALTFYDRYRTREVQLSQVEAQLTQAQLTALKMQLHPHFLFNTLHTVAILNHTNVEEANRVLVLLSDLLRLTLDATAQQEVPLKDELDFLERYIEIERARFPDRLQVELRIAPETLGAYVPNLILQPLVENAIRHGISKMITPGCVAICASRSDEQLYLKVIDNGPGMPNGKALPSIGVGLQNVQARLAQLYGSNQQFRLQPGTAGGVEVSLCFPFHTSPSLQLAAL